MFSKNPAENCIYPHTPSPLYSCPDTSKTGP